MKTLKFNILNAFIFELKDYHRMFHVFGHVQNNLQVQNNSSFHFEANILNLVLL